jgi:hypothetical protein
MRYTSLSRRIERLATNRWARQALLTLLRSVMFGISAIGIGIGYSLFRNQEPPFAVLLAIGLGCVAVGGGFLLWRRRLSTQEAARQLDQRFHLNEQLATALEMQQRGPVEGVGVVLLEQANTTSRQVQQYIERHQRRIWPEAAATFALVLLGLGLFVLLQLGDTTELPTAEALPPLVPPENVEQPPPPEENQAAENNTAPQAGAETGVSEAGAFDQESASALADALRDQSATRPAADALDQGDAAGAAESLRELADQAEQLSPETRRDLAQELQEAAARIEQNNPALADQVRESAYGMQEGQDHAEALENLADAVEQLAGNGQQQQAGTEGAPAGSDGQQQGDQGGSTGAGGSEASDAPPPPAMRERPYEPLGVDGVPLELESDGGGQASDGAGDAATSAGGSGFSPSQGAVADETVQIDEDPLRIPAELRDVVQEYFSPTE